MSYLEKRNSCARSSHEECEPNTCKKNGLSEVSAVRHMLFSIYPPISISPTSQIAISYF